MEFQVDTMVVVVVEGQAGYNWPRLQPGYSLHICRATLAPTKTTADKAELEVESLTWDLGPGSGQIKYKHLESCSPGVWS